MAELTKEWLLRTIAELEEERNAVPGFVNVDAAMALAAMKLALASLEAEPVAWDYEWASYITCEGPQNFMRIVEHEAPPELAIHEGQARNVVPLYAAPPAPVSVPDELPPHEDESYGSEDDCYKAGRVEGWNACRAAMLQAGNSPMWIGVDWAKGCDPGNSPSTPDGWIPVSERMPPQGAPLLVCSGNGVVQRTVYGFDGENWLDWYEQYDPVKAELDDLWQPLPAAPQQEMKK